MPELGVIGVSGWKSMGPQWEKYTPPVRPSEQDMLTIRERLERVLAETGATEERKAQVLVLGSTPETRNMLAGLPNVRVTLMDYMLQMTVAMTEMVTADPFDEVWIKGDWLNAPLPEHYFDAVISDLVLSNLPPAKHAGLVDRVHAALKPTGRWLNRTDCVDANSRIEDLDALLDRFLLIEEPTQADICSLRCAAGLRHWDRESSFLSWADLGRELEKYRDDTGFVHPDPRANSLLEGLWEVTAPFDKPYWLRTKEDLEEELGRRFRIEHEVRDVTVLQHHERGYYFYDLAPR
ncbi:MULTISPECIES: class I SAM-dependent methyltransferase [unclassified Streptomyces]|uniref:class I SAM-dependent methyltransferase n=1 Tax=unclassified Streptomyces TaxID=2593676 RepID=UPI0022531654|nr:MULTISPECIES: class I SAM-dependent methyltransferase [unclassified Streptomyces]MCX4628627.1 class I SAM-dependent methyltransferase [Streptomyces sp. NBC_01443]WSW44645.1 class I SAM-dependent methyltransferase [Streptomyces sp. NBC_01001]